LVKIIAASLFKIGEIDGVVHMSQGIKVAKPDLDWIPNIHEYALIFRDKNYLFTLSSQRASKQESGAYYKSLRGVFMACF
jgi:hypothetical protein